MEVQLYRGVQKDGSKIYSGQWRDEEKRQADPRYFVIVDTGEKLLPYWGNNILYNSAPSLIEWPELYAERTEIQENAFKRMKNHGALETNYGALETNYGIKKILGPDRHQQRANEELQSKLEKTEEKEQKQSEDIDAQKLKIKESKIKNHPKILPIREKKLEELEIKIEETKLKEQKIKEGIEKNGPPKERADRDFRKQSIMTIRTLCLENWLMAFFNILSQNKNLNIGLDGFLNAFFDRSGSYYETSSKIIYHLECDGLSKSLLSKIKALINSYNDLKLTRNGKIIQVRIRGIPI